MKTGQFLLASCVLMIAMGTAEGQRSKKAIACKNDVFATLKALPDLTYQCPADVADEYDERILKDVNRIQAIKDLVKQMESYTDSAWWESPAADLNACYFRGKPGALNKEENDEFTGPEYQVRLLGNNQIRLLITPDPCYQTSYNGSNAFLLYRKGSRVYVTQVLDGFYSRLAKSIFLRLSGSRSNPVIQIETWNISGMRPDKTSYYFTLDKANKAVRVKSGAQRSKPKQARTRFSAICTPNRFKQVKAVSQVENKTSISE